MGSLEPGIFGGLVCWNMIPVFQGNAKGRIDGTAVKKLFFPPVHRFWQLSRLHPAVDGDG